MIFFIVFVLLVALCIWKSAEANRSTIHEVNVQFRGLLLGIVIILGIGALLIPFLFHNERFEREVLFSINNIYGSTSNTCHTN